MSTTTTSTATPSSQVFEGFMGDVKVSKSDMNLTILNYFINKGYPESAKKFAMEANMDPVPNIDLITKKVEIRRAIHAGDIQRAIEEINEYNPQLLDADRELHFDLLCFQLLELIRAYQAQEDGDLESVLTFAETHLAPRATTSDRFLADYQKVMVLLFFPKKELKPPSAELLEPSKREALANKVNKALLQSDGDRTQSTLDELVSLRAFAEQRARNERPSLVPEQLSLGLDPPTSNTETPLDATNGSNEMATS